MKAQPVTGKRERRRRDIGRPTVGLVQSMGNMHTEQGCSWRGQPVGIPKRTCTECETRERKKREERTPALALATYQGAIIDHRKK